MKLKFILISILGSISRSAAEDNFNIRHFNSQGHNNQPPEDELDATGFNALNDKPQIIRWKMSEVLNYFEPRTNKESTKADGLNRKLVENNQFLAMLHSEIPQFESELPTMSHIMSYIFSTEEDHSNKDPHHDVMGEQNEFLHQEL